MANGTGIGSIPTGARSKTFLDTLQAISDGNILAPDMGAVAAREAELANYLGATDYAKQLTDAQGMGKLQLALALAQRGFAAAGATPVRGESPVSTLSRELLSPLAGDAGVVATQMMQQKQAMNAAQAQEERQIKLAALQDVETQGAAARALALELMPDPTATKLLADPFVVVSRGEDGGLSLVKKEDDPAAIQVRQQSGSTAVVDIKTGGVHTLLPGQEIMKLSEYSKNKGTAGKVANVGYMQNNASGKYIHVSRQGPNQPAIDSLTGAEITNPENWKWVGSTLPTAAATGTASPKFQATFSGMLASLPGMRQRMGLGQRGLAFDAKKFNLNPGLEPGENFPFTRVDGMALTEEQQANYARNLRNAYFNIFESIESGAEKTDLNRSFVTGYLDFDVASLGLPPAPEGQGLPTSPEAITRAYVAAAQRFQEPGNPAAVIGSLPLPVGTKPLRSGTGRLVLYNQLGVPFGETTQAPEVLASDASPADVAARASAVGNLDYDDIQTRILAEREARGTGLGSSLIPGEAPRLGQQLTIVGEALEARQALLDEALNDSAGREIGETLGRSLDTLAMLDRLDAQMKMSGVGGFVLGPLEQVFRSRLGMDIGAWFRTEEGQEAANELMASLPILQELVGRDLLRGVGEERISNMDLRGAKATLINLNKADGFNADTLRQLRNYLKGSVKHSLDYVGSYYLPDATLHRAAQLGIDVKSIEGRNGYYSPYLADQNYAVTKQPVPSYSQDYIDHLMDDSIFGYVAVGGSAGQETQYRLMRTDADGKPIPKLDANGNETGAYQTVLIPKTDGWQAAIANQSMLDFNRDFLIRTYGLDR